MNNQLRSKLIRLAHSKPELRAHLIPLLKQAAGQTPLYGHTSPETAYVVEDYPYGFKARTQARFWLEHNPSKGFRFLSQTMDPKRPGVWNKPKASTFSRLAGAMFLDSKGHVSWMGVNEYTDAPEVLSFLKMFPRADTGFLRKWAPAKVKFYMKLLQVNEEGFTGFSMNGERIPADSKDMERNQKSLEAWTEVQKAL